MIETPISDPDLKYLASCFERLMRRAEKPQSAHRKAAIEACIRGGVEHLGKEHGVTFQVTRGGSILSWERAKKGAEPAADLVEAAAPLVKPCP